jgi:ATP-dependent Lhr-like helicase
VLAAVEQLGGVEVAAGEWEQSVLAARVVGYDPRWLDELCLSGEVAWARLTPRPERPSDTEDGVPARRGSSTPSPATPLSLVVRDDLGWQLAAVRLGDDGTEPEAGSAADILHALRERGACFRAELPPLTRRLPAEVDEGLWDLVSRGLVTADAFGAVRSLLSSRDRWRSRTRRPAGTRAALAGRRASVGTGVGEGRWSLVPFDATGAEVGPGDDELAEAVAWQLLNRWGIVLFEIWARESYRLPWRDVVRALRRLEARGLALGGRFVAGLSGEQYALPEAEELLARARAAPAAGDDVVVAGADPLNLTGTVLAGPRVPATPNRLVSLQGGAAVPVPPDIGLRRRSVR